MRIDDFKLDEKAAITIETQAAIKAMTDEAEKGMFDDALDVVAFLTGYCSNHPVLMDEIGRTILYLRKRGLIER